MIMISRNKRPGRPPKFVHDETGKPITGFSFDKTNNSYYATYSNPRVYFGSDFPTALLEFRKWQNSQADDEPCVEIELPNPPCFGGTKTIEWDDDLAIPRIFTPFVQATNIGSAWLIAMPFSASVHPYRRGHPYP
jgi:hypothetical protein